MEVLSVLKGHHSRGICCLAFSPDGKYLATVGMDNHHTIAVWRWDRGQLLASEKGNTERIFDIEFNPNDGSLVTCGIKHVKFWQFSGNALMSKKGIFGKVGSIQTMLCIAFSQTDSETTFLGTLSGDIYEFRGRKLIRVYSGEQAHDASIFSLAYLHGGFCSGSKDGTIKTWNDTMELESTFDLNEATGRNLRIRTIDKKDGKILVGTQSAEIYEVDESSGEVSLLMQGHGEGELWGLAVHPNASQFATVSDDCYLMVWDTNSRSCMMELFLDAPARSVGYSPDGGKLAIGFLSGVVKVIDASSLDLLWEKKHRRENIGDVRFSPDGAYLAVASNDNFVDIYDVEDGYTRVGVCKGSSSYITHIDFGTDGDGNMLLRTNSGAYELLYFSVPDGRQQFPDAESVNWISSTGVLGDNLKGIWPRYSDKTDVNATDMAHSKEVVATGDDFGMVKLFATGALSSKGAKHKQYTGHSAHVTNVRFQFDDQVLISTGGGDCSIFQWKHVGADEVPADYDNVVASSDESEVDSDLENELVMENKLDDRPDRDTMLEELAEKKQRLAALGIEPTTENLSLDIDVLEKQVSQALTSRMSTPSYYGQGSSSNPNGVTFVRDTGAMYAGKPRTARQQALSTRLSTRTAGGKTPRTPRVTTSSWASDDSAPEEFLSLEHVMGYRGQDTRNNLFYNNENRLVYSAAGTGVVMNPDDNTMQFMTDHSDDVISLAIHPNKQFVATGQIGKNPYVTIWDSNSMEVKSQLKGFHKRGIAALDFSPDGEMLATVGIDDNHSIAVYNWQKGFMVASDKGSGDKIFTINFNPFNNQEFVTCGIKHISFWRIAGNGFVKKRGIIGRKGKIQTMLCAAFGPNGACYTGTSSGDIYKWEGNQLDTRIEAHKGPVYTIHQCEKGFATAGKDGILRLWDTEFNAMSEFDLGGLCMRSVCWDSENARLLVGTRSSEIIQVAEEDGSQTVLHQAHGQGEMWALCTHPTEQICFTGSDDKSLRKWSITDRQQLARRDFKRRVRACGVSPDGQQLTIGHMNGSVCVLDANTLEDAGIRFQHRREEISDIKYSPDGRFVAVGSHDNFVDVYAVQEDFKRVGTCKGHSSFITHLDWSTDSKYLRTNSGDYELLYWRAPRGKQITRHSQLKCTWATSTGVLGGDIEGIWQGTSDKTDVNACDLSRDGKLLVCADDFGQVRTFKYPAGKRASSKKYIGHSSHVTSVRFSAGDEYLLSSGGNDQCLFIWRVHHGEDDEDYDSARSDDEFDSDVDAELDVMYAPRSRKAIKASIREGDMADDGDRAASRMEPMTDTATSDSEMEFDPRRMILKTPEPESIPSASDIQRQAAVNSNASAQDLELEFVQGYRARDCRNNLFFTNNGELVYNSAGVGIVHNVDDVKQRHFLGHADDIISMAIHPDKNIIATGQIGKPAFICIWDTENMKLLSLIKNAHQRGVATLGFSTNGKFLVSTGLDDNHEITVWRWSHGTKLMSAKGHTEKIFSSRFSPNDETRIVTCGVKHIKFWNLAGNVFKSEKGIFGRNGTLQTMLDVAFGEGDIVYSGAQSGDIYVWEGRKLQRVIEKAHTGSIHTIYTNPGVGFATGAKDGKVKLWDTEMNPINEFQVMEEGKKAIKSVCWEDDKILVGSLQSDVFILDANSGEKNHILNGHSKGELWGLDAHPFENQFVTCSDDKTVRTWSIDDRTMIAKMETPKAARSCCYSPDGSTIAVGLINGQFVIYDSDLKEIIQRRHRKEAIHAIKYSPCGQYLAVGSHDNFVDIYSVERNYKRVGNCRGHSSFITHIDWSVDSTMLVSNSGDYEKLIWAMPSGRLITKSKEYAGIEMATQTGVLGDELEALYQGTNDKTDVNSAVVSKNGKTVASATDMGTIRVYPFPATQGTKPKVYLGHSSHVTTVRYNSDDTYLLSTGGMDQSVFIWRVLH
eukprot:TRINITY_DN1595_c0_g1_i1.p1 TRINITY_DN1595_c0_g1~~TRINITY_DN1595_c0_g1_i1.p1  ORF type:complete len:1924 (+),score=719.51 TRINITY_DN1595_c0_g1_i1:2008-7779(+)